MLDAVYDFIVKFAPDVTEENIFRGYGNRLALPESQEYVIFGVTGSSRIGTNVNDFSAESSVTTNVLREYTVSIDFCSAAHETARVQAAALENIGRCYIGTEFFAEYGVNLNYTDDLQYLPFTDETDQYVERYRVTLHITVWENTTVAQEYAEEVKAGVYNVDVRYK